MIGCLFPLSSISKSSRVRPATVWARVANDDGDSTMRTSARRVAGRVGDGAGVISSGGMDWADARVMQSTC